MPPTALALVLGAGLLHASWNLILKRTTERLLVAAWGLFAGAAAFAPALVQAWPPPVTVWPFACGSALVLLGYYTCLARAYDSGDFSGYTGIGAILAGLVVLGAAPLWSLRRRDPAALATLRTHARGSGLAFLVAFLISTYSALDGAAMRHWEPVPYLVLVFGLSGSLLIPLLAFREGDRVVRVLRSHFVPIVVIAVMTLAAYSLVLRAFQIAPVSYAGAAREVGIVFGALAGWLLLGERFGGIRTAGAALVFVGILVLAVAG